MANMLRSKDGQEARPSARRGAFGIRVPASIIRDRCEVFLVPPVEEAVLASGFLDADDGERDSAKGPAPCDAAPDVKPSGGQPKGG